MDMIDNKIDDELLAKFFENNKIGDIPDDGFSDRVMHTLPKHNEWLNTLWTAVCAIAIFAYFISVMDLMFLNWLFLISLVIFQEQQCRFISAISLRY